MNDKTLIELMIEANVEWPEGAEFAAQDKLYPRLWFYIDEPERREGLSFWRGGNNDFEFEELTEIASDWGTTIITRAEYQAAQDKAERDRIFGYSDETIDVDEAPEQSNDKEMTIEQKIKDMVFHQESIARYQEQIKANQVIVDKLRTEISADLAALGWGE